MDPKKIFQGREKEAVFVKTVQRPVIDGSQKAALNRRGNVLFGEGDIEGARKIFITTGYSDGLARVGDWYKSHGKPLDALRMYWIAPDRTKALSIIEELSGVVRSLVHEDGAETHE